MEASVGLGVLLLMVLLGLLGAAIGIGGAVLWIWMLVDCATNEPSEGNDKIVWILVIVLAGGVGALLYLLVRRPERRRVVGR